MKSSTDTPTLALFRSPLAIAPLSFMCFDLKGPITPQSLGGKKYWMLGTCKTSRWRFSLFLKHKSEVIQLVDEIRLKILSMGGTWKWFKSDAGGEFMSDELHRYLLEHRIDYEISVPYTPQQNGIAERSNRTVAEMSVAMMIAAAMPKFLWPYAVMSAVDVLNVLPTRATNMQTTPYIMVHGHIPDVSHLRTLGCDAFAYLQEHKRDSYGARAVKGIHLGKDPHSLGYLFFNVETRQTYVTGHITFNEDLSSKSVESADDYATFQSLLDTLIGPDTQDEPQEVAEDDLLAPNAAPPTPATTPAAVRINHSDALRLISQPVPTQMDSISSEDPTLASKRTAEKQSHTKSKFQKYVKLTSEKSNLSDDDVVPDLTDDTSDSDEERNDTHTRPGKKSQRNTSVHQSAEPVMRRSVRAQEKTVRYGHYANFSAEDASHAFVSSGYYDKTYEKLLEDTHKELAHLQVESDIPDGGPDNNSPSYKEAMAGPDKHHWVQAIKKEIEQLEALKVWEVLDKMPPTRVRQRPLKYKWVLKVKYEKGVPIKYKARLTAMGCHQREGIDFSETFSPVARLTVLRMIIALGVTEDFVFWQADVSNAFPNADLEEEVFMEAPPELGLPKGTILRLLKALYGLKQASRMWHLLVRDFLLEQGFDQLRTDNCVFIYRIDGHTLIIVLYVDDMVLAATTPALIKGFLEQCRQRFNITDRSLEWILGMRFRDTRTIDGKITLDLDDYADSMLQRLAPYIPDGRAVSTPIAHGTKLSKTQAPATPEEHEQMSTLPYRSIIGMLMYLVNAIRLDLAYAVNTCARYMANPGPAHWAALQRILKRLHTAPHARLCFIAPTDSSHRNVILMYGDSDYASDIDDRKCMSGGISFVNGGPVWWMSRKQKSQASSTGEGEFKAQHELAKEAMFERQFYEELGFKQHRPTTLYGDNDACTAFMKNPVLHGRMKHIDIAYHTVKDWTAAGYIVPVRIDTALNIADGFTKAQAWAEYRYFIRSTLWFATVVTDDIEVDGEEA
jgi:hypothetical protein